MGAYEALLLIRRVLEGEIETLTKSDRTTLSSGGIHERDFSKPYVDVRKLSGITGLPQRTVSQLLKGPILYKAPSSTKGIYKKGDRNDRSTAPEEVKSPLYIDHSRDGEGLHRGTIILTQYRRKNWRRRR